MKRLSTVLLLILIVAMAFSLTSCAEGQNTIVDILLENYPEEGNAIVELAHQLGDQLNAMIDNFLTFEWAEIAWNWANDFFGITRSIDAIKTGVDAISRGEDVFQSIINMITGVSVLFVGGVLLLASVLIAIVFDIIVEIATILLTIIGLVALVALIVLGVMFLI